MWAFGAFPLFGESLSGQGLKRQERGFPDDAGVNWRLQLNSMYMFIVILLYYVILKFSFVSG